MTGMNRNRCMWLTPGKIVLPLVLGIAAYGAAAAQQPLVVRAMSPVLHPALQSDPNPAMQPEAPQGNGAPLKDDLFAGTEKFAKGASDVTEVTMDPDTLNYVGGDDAKKAHRTVLSVVRTYTYDKPGMYNPADVEEYRHKLESGDWHCSIHTRDLKNGESTDVCSKRRAPDMVENAIITVSPKSLTFIHNIRKVNGQGGGLDLGIMPGVGMISGWGPMMSMEMLGPEIQAQIMASTAVLRAQMPQVMANLQNFRFELSPEQKEQMDKLGKGLHIEINPKSLEQLKDFHFEMSPEQMQ